MLKNNSINVEMYLLHVLTHESYKLLQMKHIFHIEVIQTGLFISGVNTIDFVQTFMLYVS